MIQLLVGLGRDGRRRPPLRRGAAQHRREPRGRGRRPRAGPRAAGDRAAGEGQQLLLGREGKDSLALGNITGAMVFQSTIPVGFGLLFTDWDLSANAASRSRSASPAACSPTRPCTAAAASRCRRSSPGSRSTRLHRHRDRRPERLRPLQLGERLEHDLVVRLRRDLREDLGDLALGVDQEGRPLHAHVLLAVHRLLDPGAVGLGDGVVGVGEQGEVEVVFAGELRDRLDLVGGDADHPRARPRRSRRGGRGRRRPGSCSRACRRGGRSRGRPSARAGRRASPRRRSGRAG